LVDLPFNAAYTSSDGLSVAAWDFRHLDSLIANTIGRTSGSMMLNVRYAPDNMFAGSGPLGGNGTSEGALLDQTYGAFATYMANLVRYYNTSNSPAGAIPPRPPGVGPIRYWEIWNEPDYAAENPRLPPTLPPPSGVTLTGVSVPGSTVPELAGVSRSTWRRCAGVRRAGRPAAGTPRQRARTTAATARTSG
jgi:hypothetical protein